MKKQPILNSILAMVISAIILPQGVFAQKEDRVAADSKAAKTRFINTDKLMQGLFDKSYAYVIFPNVGKGAVGVGGAAGNGTVYEQGRIIGSAKMLQVSVGVQLGGQAYREVIFFEDKAALERFKNNNLEFAAQTSAVAVKSGAAANIKYRDGVLVFTQEKSGLMYEASIGGQKFTYSAM